MEGLCFNKLLVYDSYLTQSRFPGSNLHISRQLASSNRMGSARNALKEVQSRAEDIKRIEQTISELAQMFNDVSSLWYFPSFPRGKNN